MPRYAAFLRGVNVGGVNLVMADVAAALTDAGFADVRTILAGGNVLLDAAEGVAVVRGKAEAGPSEKIARGDGVVYWQVPKGFTLDSTIGKTMEKARYKRYKSSTTTRNLRTLTKVLCREALP
ncbi:DUF1697 domain-containing protein [Mycobacterium sp. Lab-001]|uniref:DUF1697 domain-containing protein n=1 Tax=Mycobacterium sp. Lab-001 TaxID=3410136 RepID=UPI003D16958F